jgi:hypothetical protein
MDNLFLALAFASLVGLFVGLVKPSIVKVKSRKQSLLFFGGGALVLFILFGITSPQSTQNGSTPEQSASATQPASASKVGVGEEGYINVSSPKAILALTEDNFKELTKIYLADDTQGIYEFLVAGKGFAVADGTKVKVIDSSVGTRRVRVLEGDMAEKSGWIAMEWVSKTK